MAVIRLASFSGGGGVGVRAGRAFSQQYHATLMYGWEFLGDPTVEVPQELLSRIEYLPDEDDSTEYDLTDSERRGWLAAFAKEYAHSEHLRELCEYSLDDWDYPIENPQVEDDEDKEVVESTTQTTEDTHGGSEATKSIENSPSSADDGKEDKNNSTSKGENSGGSSGKDGDTEADKEGNGTGTESKEGEGSGAPEDTDADKEGKGTGTEPGDGEEKDSGASVDGDSSEVTNKIVSDLISAFEEEANDRHNREAITSAFAMVLKNTKGKSDKGNRLGGWDGRAITKHYISGMLNRIPADRKRYGAVKQVTVAIDCSGSCWTYLNEINRAIRHIARFYNVQILDCSNGFNIDKDSTVSDTDPYNNRKRLEEAFCEDARIKMHHTITTPSIETAAKIAMESEAFIVLADYDGYMSICRMVQQVTNPAKYPWFLDLEERYEDPSDHDWNYDPDQDRYISADDYPEPARKRWLRLFDRGCDDNE